MCVVGYVTNVGHTMAKKAKAEDTRNRLFYGDNLDVMRSHIGDASVDLCYIDPPFNSQRNYNQIYNRQGDENDLATAQAFADTWTWDVSAQQAYADISGNEGGRYNTQTIELMKGLRSVLGTGNLLAYIVSMTARIVEIHRVLKESGSFYLHCDPTASHYLKLVCDAVFIPAGGDFQSEIIWRRTAAHNKLTRYGPIHDVILFYTKSTKGYTWNYPKRPYMRGHVQEYFVKDANGWRTNYYGNVLTGSGTRNGESGKEWQGINPTDKNRHWAVPGKVMEELLEIEPKALELGQHEKLDLLLKHGFIVFTDGEYWPVYQHYLRPSDGQPLGDIWAYQPYTQETVFGTKECIDEDVRWMGTKDAERLGYPTQKPEGLMGRIIRASSNEGDVVLDAFCGCGTTVVVSHALHRRWIGIDITYQSISLILKRITDDFGAKDASAINLSGVPRDIASAKALANKKDDRLRKEFEKWAALTFSNNRAVINEKKGADGGIDGIAYTAISTKDTAQVIIQVKSGHVGEKDIRDLIGTVKVAGAVMGYMLTLEEPTAPMKSKANSAGVYKHPLMGKSYPIISIITIKEIIEGGVRISLPLPKDVVRSARGKDAVEQHSLPI